MFTGLFPSPRVHDTPKVKVGGLGRAAQKLQAAREKAENMKNGSKAGKGHQANTAKLGNPMAGTKKTSFQRKSV